MPNDFAHLIKYVKDKMKIANRRETLQILTLAPNSWTVPKTAIELGVPKSTTIQKANTLTDSKDIISKADILL